VALDPNAVAVLPFEVRTSDPALATLDEGIIDFLYPILSGDAGPRAIEPNPFLLALADRKARGQWGSADAPLRLAAHFRASQVLEGRVAQVGPRLTLNAWLRRVPDGVTVAQSTVSGPADSLYALIPQLAVALLGSHLGESAERIAALSGRPSVAVTAYLAGSRAERDGRRDDAVRYYGQALDADSTFALAGLRLLLVPQTASENSSTRRARRGLGAARAHANSLGMRERAALKLLAGLYDSAWTVVNTVAAARAWVEAAPDDPQAWRVYAYNGLGSAGPVIGPDWEQQTRNAIRWAWERDSTTAGSVEDLLSIATTLFPQDLALLRHLGRRYLEVADSSSDDWAGLAWATALASGDSSAVRAFRARAVSGDSKVLRWHNRTRVEQVEQAIGPRRDDSQLLARELRQTRLLSASDSANFAGSRIYTGIDEGKSEEVIDVLRGPLGPRWTGSRAFPWDLLIAYSLIHPGFEHAASEAAESLRVFISSRPDPGPLHLCHLDLYRAVHGDTVGLRSHVRELIPQFTDRVPLCPVLVEALVESRDRERPKTPALDSLESVLWKGWGQAAFPGQVAAALLTRMLRQRGEFARALAVTQLHEAGYGYFHYTQRCPLLKEEGELAALLGDTTRAIAAFRRYLEIRIDPDEGMREEREQVRAALDALVRAKG
jgi:serine/threonine-protein kinase